MQGQAHKALRQAVHHQPSKAQKTPTLRR
jgi:hypothetical protein